jgi:hypothetical protein
MMEWMHWNPKATYISLTELAEILKIGMAKTEGIEGSRVYDEFYRAITTGSPSIVCRMFGWCAPCSTAWSFPKGETQRKSLGIMQSEDNEY